MIRDNTFSKWENNGETIRVCHPNIYEIDDGYGLIKPIFPLEEHLENAQSIKLTGLKTTKDLTSFSSTEIAQVAAYFVRENMWKELQALQLVNMQDNPHVLFDYNSLYFSRSGNNLGTLLDLKTKSIATHQDLNTVIFLISKGGRGMKEKELIKELTDRAEQSTQSEFQFRCLYTANLVRLLTRDLTPVDLVKRGLIESSSQKINPFSAMDVEETTLVKKWLDMFKQGENKEPKTFEKMLEAFGATEELSHWENHARMLGVQTRFGAPVVNAIKYSYSVLGDLSPSTQPLEYGVELPDSTKVKETFKFLQITPEEKTAMEMRLSITPELERALFLRTFYDFKIFQREYGKNMGKASNGEILAKIESNQRNLRYPIAEESQQALNKATECFKTFQDDRVFSYNEALFSKNDYYVVGDKLLAQAYWNRSVQSTNVEEKNLEQALDKELERKSWWKRMFLI